VCAHGAEPAGRLARLAAQGIGSDPCVIGRMRFAAAATQASGLADAA
jgi:hypothetical protein